MSNVIESTLTSGTRSLEAIAPSLTPTVTSEWSSSEVMTSSNQNTSTSECRSHEVMTPSDQYTSSFKCKSHEVMNPPHAPAVSSKEDSLDVMTGLQEPTLTSDDRSDNVVINSRAPTFGKAVLLVSGIACYGLSIGLPISLSVMFLHWQDSFNASRARTAAVHGTCVGTLFGAGVIPGYLMSRFGARITVLLGTFVSSLGLFLSAFGTSLEYLIVTTGVVTGLGFCMVQLPCMPCVLLPFNKYHGVILSALSAGCGVTGLILPYLTDLIMEKYTWRGAFFIMCGLALNNGVLALVMTSTTASFKHERCVDNSTHGNNEPCETSKNDTGFPEERKLLEVKEENERYDENKTLDDIQAFEIFETFIQPTTEDADRCFDKIQTLQKIGILDGKRQILDKTDDMDTAYNKTPGSKEIKSCSLQHTQNCEDCTFYETNVNYLNTKNAEVCPRDYKESLVTRGQDLKQKNNERSVSREMKVKSSKFSFLLNPLVVSYYLVISIAVGSFYTFFILQMDFAHTHMKESESVGLICFMTMVISGLIGRLSAGPINLLPYCHSVTVMTASAMTSSSALLILAVVTQLEGVIALVAIIGFGMGVSLSIYPKVILDLKVVFTGSYPLALGLACTGEGLCEIINPVLVGYAVDVTGSYFLPLMVMGFTSLVVVLAFFIGWRITEWRKSLGL